jgi:hypothetical protein
MGHCLPTNLFMMALFCISSSSWSICGDFTNPISLLFVPLRDELMRLLRVCELRQIQESHCDFSQQASRADRLLKTARNLVSPDKFRVTTDRASRDEIDTDETT